MNQMDIIGTYTIILIIAFIL